MVMGGWHARDGVTARGRWAAVLAVTALLCAVPILINLRPVHAAPVDPAALRERIAASRSRPYQGYAQTTGLLPLPPLPNLEQVTALVSTTTEMRTWYAAEDRWRVDVLGAGTENDLYQTPGAQYVWDYGTAQLSRIDGDQPIRLPRAADLTPPVLVRALLGVAADERFQALPGRRVAGLEATGMRMVPATGDTTVDHVDIWADPRSGLPVQAEITARGGVRPVFVSRFLELHQSTPDAAVLTPPAPHAGIGYTETEAPDILSAINRRGFGVLPDRLAGRTRHDALAEVSAAGVYGSGLAQFVVVALPGRFGGEAYRRLSAFGTKVAVPRGEASLLSTGLLTVLAVRGDQTYLVAGLVQPALLRQVAGDLARAAA
jgi:hypothetical protein